MDFRDRIRQRLEELDKKVTPTSLEAGLSATYLRKLLKNTDQSPSIEALEAIAKALETTTEWLLYGREGDKDMDSDLKKVVSIWPKLLARDRAEFADWLEFKSHKASSGDTDD